MKKTADTQRGRGKGASCPVEDTAPMQGVPMPRNIKTILSKVQAMPAYSRVQAMQGNLDAGAGENGGGNGAR